MSAFRVARRAVVLFLALSLSGCETPLEDRIITLDATGVVRVLVFRDLNANEALDANDAVVPGGTILIRRSAAQDDSLVIVTNEFGTQLSQPLAVGRYIASIQQSVLGDTVVRLQADTTFDLSARDTANILLGVKYPSRSIQEFRDDASNRKLWIRGVMLNGPGTFGDSTLHIMDAEAAIRLINLRFNIQASPGDTLDVLGTRSSRAGQPAVDPLIIVRRGGGLNPPPIPLTTAEAKTAAGGTRDAAFVIVRNALVIDTTSTFDGRVLEVDDGSGPVEVLLTAFQNFSPLGNYVPGVRLDISGLLVPDPNGTTWILKPRMRADIVIRLP